MKRRRRWIPAGVLLIVALFAIAGPLIIPWPPDQQDLHQTLRGPSRAHLLGTDNYGRDTLSRLAAGGARSLALAAACVASASCLGATLGLAAASFGRRAEWLILRATDLAMAFPGLLLTLLLVGMLGGGDVAIYGSLVATTWPEYCRVTYAAARTTLASPYVEAARVVGFSPVYLARRYVAPVIAPYILSLATLSLGRNILAITSLSFIGFGVRPPEAAWGAMIAELAPYFHEAPVQVLAPCVLIFAVVFASQWIAHSWPRKAIAA